MIRWLRRCRNITRGSSAARGRRESPGLELLAVPPTVPTSPAEQSSPANPSDKLEPLTGRAIVRLALVSEGILAGLALAWISYRDISLDWTVSGALTLCGLTIVGGLLALNYHLFLRPEGTHLNHPAVEDFTRTIVTPLCRALSPTQALIVALAAGIGEELFFRAALIPELSAIGGPVSAAIISGVLFGWLHFIGVSRRFAPVVGLYVLLGIFLGALYVAVANIALLIAVHAMYDWCIILLVKRRFPT
jgi:membrane protease YdiL (CAAX protease family)